MYKADTVLELLEDVFREVERQEYLWGVQTHPDGTGGSGYVLQANNARKKCDERFKDGEGTYADILKEEAWEALAAKPNSAELIDELIQTAAVCISWARSIKDR